MTDQSKNNNDDNYYVMITNCFVTMDQAKMLKDNSIQAS